MSNVQPDYPAAVWDGLSENTQHLDIADDVEPNPQDWAQIVEEVRAVQEQQKEDREFDAVNDEGSAIVAGQVLYMKTDGTVAEAIADGAAALRIPVGMAKTGAANGDSVEIIYNGRLTLTLAEWDAVGLTSAGLVIGAAYYLDDVSGEITVAVPTSATDTLFKMGVAISATTLLVRLDDEGLKI